MRKFKRDILTHHKTQRINNITTKKSKIKQNHPLRTPYVQTPYIRSSHVIFFFLFIFSFSLVSDKSNKNLKYNQNLHTYGPTNTTCHGSKNSLTTSPITFLYIQGMIIHTQIHTQTRRQLHTTVFSTRCYTPYLPGNFYINKFITTYIPLPNLRPSTNQKSSPK